MATMRAGKLVVIGEVRAEGRRKRVYVAGPYTKPDPVANTRAAVLVGSELWDLGYAPFVPHMNLVWHMVDPRPYDHWMAYDREWLLACDALLRLPGESLGADVEMRDAVDNSIPVFHYIAHLLREMPP